MGVWKSWRDSNSLSLWLTAPSMWPPLYSYSKRQSMTILWSYLSLYFPSRISSMVSLVMRGIVSVGSSVMKWGSMGS